MQLLKLTLFLCSSVTNGSVTSFRGLGVRLDPGVRPTSPLSLINNNSDKYAIISTGIVASKQTHLSGLYPSALHI